MIINRQLIHDVLVQLHVHDVDQERYAYVKGGTTPSHLQVNKVLRNLTPQHNNGNGCKIQESSVLEHEKVVCA